MTLLVYLLKLVSCTALFYAYYYVVLRNKRMHQYNRFYILASITLSIILPLIRLPLLATGNNEQGIGKTLQGIAFGGWENEFVITAKHSLIFTIITARHIIAVVYVFGLLLAIYPLIRSLIYLKSLADKHQVRTFDTIRLYYTTEPGTPFSFFNNVFWNSSISMESEEGRQILRHELYHIKEKHSYDILIMQFACSIFWFNPFCYLMNKELKVIHEFLADEYAASGKDKRHYAEMLVMQAILPKQIFIANQFFYNQIKRRITMILQNTTTRYSYIRKAMALPVLLFMFCACSVKNKDEARLPLTNSKTNATNYEATFTKVEIEASYPGGSSVWMNYLNKNFKYPQQAQDQGIQGSTVVQFIVEKDGSLSDIHSISGQDILAKEAVRIITQSGKWIPAQQEGRLVRSYKKQPITFMLE